MGIDRWPLKFQRCNPRIVYHPFIQNAAEMLSRKPIQSDTLRDSGENYINAMTLDSIPSAITIEELFGQRMTLTWISSKPVF